MTNSLSKDQQGPPEKPKTPEQIREERIAKVSDPAERAEIQKLQDAKKERLTEVVREQRTTYDSRVAQLTQAKVNSRNAPQPAPPGMKPAPVLDKWGRHMAGTDAKADIQRLDARQAKLIGESFDRKVDQQLDAFDKARDGRSPQHQQRYQQTSPDRSSR